ncbi:hypothetical protein H5410_041960, partial [Solanum commersonii]
IYSLEPKDFKFTAPSLEFSSTINPPRTVEAPLVTYIKIHECNKFSVDWDLLFATFRNRGQQESRMRLAKVHVDACRLHCTMQIFSPVSRIMRTYALLQGHNTINEDETRSYAWLEERNDEQFVVLAGTYDGPTIKL